MANFKLGQRVRIVNKPEWASGGAKAACGQEGVLVGRGGWLDWKVDVPALGCYVFADECALEPLTDPKADESFARFMRKVQEPRPELQGLVKDPAPAWDHA